MPFSIWPARRAEAPPQAARVAETTANQVAAAGASVGSWGRDPIDGDLGYRPAGAASLGPRAVPEWTAEKARTYSVAAYRTNPMARAIVDTYTSFVVGDSGVSYQVTNPDVRVVVDEFWNDPRNNLGALQEPWLRDHLIMGETLMELMTGPASGVVRFCPLEPSRIFDVSLVRGNPLWPDRVWIDRGWEQERGLRVAAVDDATGLRTGEALFWRSWRALLTDRRGMPFMAPIIDWLDNYDTVLSNLIDRTALARYLVWDVTVQGGQGEVDNFITQRGGTHVPRSGSVEVHNEAVTWDAKTAQTGAYEDAHAAKSVLTSVASGAGLAKTWLAEPEDANRATSLTMAEPVRRRVGGVQKLWLGYQTEVVRYAVDRAVEAKRIKTPTVQATDPTTGQTYEVPAAQSVTVTGPEVAAADAQITASVLLNLSTGLEKLVEIGALTREGAAVAARKGWEDFMGIPYTADLDRPDGNRDDLATAVDDAERRRSQLRPA